MKPFLTRNMLLIVAAVAVVAVYALQKPLSRKPTATPPVRPAKPTAVFLAYWPMGRAELNYYRLEQAQQGKLRDGSAVLLFKTGDFRTDSQLVTDSAGRDRTTRVLALTRTRMFATNQTDYTLSTSTFTPIDPTVFPNTLRVSAMQQDWTGHNYLQLSYHNDSYQLDGWADWEGDAHESYAVEKAWLEDELWTRIRLDPNRLPVGNIQLIPGTMATQLRRKRLERLPVRAQLGPYAGVLYPGKFLRAYTLQYPSDDRALTIVFEGQFPHKIVGWEETYRSGNNLLTSRAVLQRTVRADYQTHNVPADSTLRQTLLSGN